MVSSTPKTPKPIDFRAEVAAWVEAHSRSTLAVQSGVARPNISAWLGGKADITVSTLERLLAVVRA